MRHLLIAITAAAPGLLAAVEPSPDDAAFFESRIQPLLQKRCFECHSHEKKIKGGLALDSRNGWQHGGDNGPALIPGDTEKSLLIKAVRYLDSDFQMPPKAKLPPEEIALFEQWIRQGAPDPRAETAAVSKRVIDIEQGRRFWAFQPVANPAPPAVRNTAWPLDSMDRFILARLDAANLAPAADADRPTWLRRVSLDLTGLPPAPTDIAAFLKDNAPDACEKVVDRLLSSRAFGERWARHWLDLTGYADMMGTSNSVFAEHAWRYRDYLINAFNADKPFDQFVREQIAGDLLPAHSPAQRADHITATGFLMVGDVEIVNPDKARMEADHIDAQITKIGAAFLGMTLGCVRCHDHKFDPIGVQDYYGIAGMLRSSPSTHKIPFGVWSHLNATELPESPDQLASRKQREAAHEQSIDDLKKQQTGLNDEKKSVAAQLAQIEKTEKDAAKPSTNRAPATTPKPATKADAACAGTATNTSTTVPETPKPSPDKETLTKRRTEIDDNLKKLGTQIQHAEFFRSMVPKAFAMRDSEAPADMPVYIRGNPYAPGPVIPRGVMRVASWAPFPAIPQGQSGRLQLADWLADPRNPLTARVAVNRVWQKLFGEGLVRSMDYFGERGERPSHPELLDHLATRFMREGWSPKKLLRALVLSRTYRMAGTNNATALQTDPDNRLLWRMNRLRLDAEAIRDSLLAVSGELQPSTGGPALVLENPANTGSLVQKGINPPSYTHRVPRPSQEFERTIYLPVMRGGFAGPDFAGPDRLRGTFDFIDPAQIAGQRPQTVVPTQALFLLNNDLPRKRAAALARDLVQKHPDRAARVEELWLRVLSRPATPEERADAHAFLDQLTHNHVHRSLHS